MIDKDMVNRYGSKLLFEQMKWQIEDIWNYVNSNNIDVDIENIELTFTLANECGKMEWRLAPKSQKGERVNDRQRNNEWYFQYNNNDGMSDNIDWHQHDQCSVGCDSLSGYRCKGYRELYYRYSKCLRKWRENERKKR
jgi:hypothetical protein